MSKILSFQYVVGIKIINEVMCIFFILRLRNLASILNSQHICHISGAKGPCGAAVLNSADLHADKCGYNKHSLYLYFIIVCEYQYTICSRDSIYG